MKLTFPQIVEKRLPLGCVKSSFNFATETVCTYQWFVAELIHVTATIRYHHMNQARCYLTYEGVTTALFAQTTTENVARSAQAMLDHARFCQIAYENNAYTFEEMLKVEDTDACFCGGCDE